MKKPGIIGEFKQFIMRGNVVDLAVGVLIGASFQAIVKSLVDDVISPLIGCLGTADFSKYGIVLKEATETTEAVVLTYGNFINSIINFLLMAICIFVIVKVFNTIREKSAKKEVAEEAPTTKLCPFCKSEIAVEATRCPHCTSELEEA